MINRKLLDKELEDYRAKGIELKPMKFNKNKFYNLFKKYKSYGMTENYYCCYGEERCCWQDLVERGCWHPTLECVRKDMILSKNMKHIVRCRKYGDRFYISKDKDKCAIFIYARDTEQQEDLHMWFSSREA